jgi:hypothetical protein
MRISTDAARTRQLRLRDGLRFNIRRPLGSQTRLARADPRRRIDMDIFVITTVDLSHVPGTPVANEMSPVNTRAIKTLLKSLMELPESFVIRADPVQVPSDHSARAWL